MLAIGNVATALSKVPLGTWLKIGAGVAMGAAAASVALDAVSALTGKLANSIAARSAAKARQRQAEQPRASV
jgi:hypothetical protein